MAIKTPSLSLQATRFECLGLPKRFLASRFIFVSLGPALRGAQGTGLRDRSLGKFIRGGTHGFPRVPLCLR